MKLGSNNSNFFSFWSSLLSKFIILDLKYKVDLGKDLKFILSSALLIHNYILTFTKLLIFYYFIIIDNYTQLVDDQNTVFAE